MCVLSFVLPGNHFCSLDALRLPDDAHSVLRVVQVVQQHSDHVVPVLRALIGLSCVLIPEAHGTHIISFSLSDLSVFTVNTLRVGTYFPSASLALAYCRWILGEETCGSSSPTFDLNIEKNNKRIRTT